MSRLLDLPVGTTFYVENGNWRGQIVLDKDFEKAIKILPNSSRQIGAVTCFDPTEIRILRNQTYRKITEDVDLILSDIVVPEDANSVPESSKEYFDYLIKQIK